jgi:putative PIN family toxin of toxin-antitoxin system
MPSLDAPRLVLDTNTVLALWLFRDPALARLGTLAGAGRLTLLTRGDALEELRRVLAYRQFALDATTQAALLADYRLRATRLPDAAPTPLPLPPCRDPDDQKFLEIARDGAALALLTRDKALLRLARHRLIRARFAILTPESWQAGHGLD